MVCEPYATLGCGLVYLHAKFYGDTLNSWSFIISTIYYKFGPKMHILVTSMINRVY